MRIKKYVAKSMREALLEIKNELGEEAIILKTRKLPKKVFSLGSQDEVEVTAAIDEEMARPQTFHPLKVNSATVANTGVYSRPRSSNIIDINEPDAPEVRLWKPPVTEQPSYSGQRVLKNSSKFSGSEVCLKDVSENQQISDLKENINELKELIKNILENGNGENNDGFTGGWAKFYKKLVDSEVKPQIAEKLIKKFNGTDILISESHIEKKVISVLNKSFPVAGPLRLKKNVPVIVAFVGPTGSGKTTTLAKLAAHCCLNKNKNVSIITADTYRIAAIEQIRMFAEIVKVGLQVVFSPDEIPAALDACRNDDIVFIDTAGRSQKNNEHMEELKDLLVQLGADETHLVLSATTKDSDLADVIKRYRAINVNRLIFTKLDETVKIGNIFNTVSEADIPVSYFTFGQSVPDDIELAQTTRFVQRLWEGKTV
ncbi:MAG: flagellar biosynthesis protein FlhF [Fibrobacter sp.]|nr:flagellar biosynthesis protein FlhF [Fibrobacter sp.]